MTSATISKVSAGMQAKMANQIEAALLEALAGVNVQSTNTSIVLIAACGQGQMIGGVTGTTSYGWLLVKTLWVKEDQRGSGLGRQLMQAIEDEAARLECHDAWLDTSNAQARAFYLRLGYGDFGVLENGPDQAPASHCRWFMKKPLKASK